jgi:hypothetical protein
MPVNHFETSYIIISLHFLENLQLKTQLENSDKDSISLRFPTKVVCFYYLIKQFFKIYIC